MNRFRNQHNATATEHETGGIHVSASLDANTEKFGEAGREHGSTDLKDTRDGKDFILTLTMANIKTKNLHNRNNQVVRERQKNLPKIIVIFFTFFLFYLQYIYFEV